MTAGGLGQTGILRRNFKKWLLTDELSKALKQVKIGSAMQSAPFRVSAKIRVSSVMPSSSMNF
jgi:hypothetical protein